MTLKAFAAAGGVETFVLFGADHFGTVSKGEVFDCGSWESPVGEAVVDEELASALVDAGDVLRSNPGAHRSEHSLEVQLPFLQVLQPDICMSAICLRAIDYAMLEDLGHAMARIINSLQEPVLMVASSDMTHYESAEDASRQDQFAIDQILSLDPAGLHQVVVERNISMCGFAGAVAVLIACRDLGASSARLIRYTNSGVASGDYGQVVAYAGMAIS